MCGKNDRLLKVIIEGAYFSVCNNCKVYGKVIETNEKIEIKKPVFKRAEIVEDVVVDYSNLIKNARENLQLNQTDLALKLNIKEGLISKIENGSIKPDLNLAKKIGKFLNINLVTTEKISDFATKSNNKVLTIGDFFKK